MDVLIENLSDALQDIREIAYKLHLVKFQRGYRQESGGVIPASSFRWLVTDAEAIKRLMVEALGRNRAIAVGSIVAATEEGLKFYRLIELLSYEEVLSFREALIREQLRN
jgi:hypothetical protein